MDPSLVGKTLLVASLISPGYYLCLHQYLHPFGSVSSVCFFSFIFSHLVLSSHFLNFSLFLSLFMHVYVCLCGYAQVCASALRGYKRGQISQSRSYRWLWASQSGWSRISDVLNCQAISPAHFNLIFVAVGVDPRGRFLTRQAVISRGAVSLALTLALWLSHKQQLTMEKPFSPQRSSCAQEDTLSPGVPAKQEASLAPVGSAKAVGLDFSLAGSSCRFPLFFRSKSRALPGL